MNYSSLTSRLALGCFALFCGACELNVTLPPDGAGGTAGAGGGPIFQCEPYSTTECWDGCEGYQSCSEAGQWGECQCYGAGGSSTGGAPSTGGVYSTGGYIGTGAVGTGGGYGGCGAGGAGGSPSVGTIIPVDGWVDVASNPYGIQGAVFAYSDGHSAVATDFTGTNACMSGTAPRVDASCSPEAPVTDCWGVYWGAALGLNLNQPIDPSTGAAANPLPYDASAFSGFAFDINGSTIPTGLRFVVEDGLGQKCTPPAKPILAGHNEVYFSELLSECWAAQGTQPDPSSIVMISWHVATNDAAETPFDFCVSNISPLERVLLLK